MRTIILFLTHSWSSNIKHRFDKLYKELDSSYKLVPLIQTPNNLHDLESDSDFYYFDTKSLSTLGYKPIAKSIVPGSTHFPILQYFRDFSAYDFYWKIEYDIFFTGNWSVFFNYYSTTKSDFITSNIHKYPYDPFWIWWNSLITNHEIPMRNRLCSFNPICRFSNRSLRFLDSELKKGNCGHDEVLLPTLLYINKFTLLDIGKNSDKEFLLPNHKSFITKGERYTSEYQSGSMRYRPLISIEEMTDKNILYHPFKD
ncbi:MAG: hypothetical protein ACOYJE_00425 [Bacteroidaceae bacterium]|jgi:hypothetical protein